MLQRIIYSLIIIPVVLYVVVSGGLPLRAALLVVSAIALLEMYKALYTKLNAINYFGFLFVGILYLFIDTAVYYFFAFVMIWVIINFLYIVFSYEKTQGNTNPIHHIANIVLPIYIGFLITIYLSRDISPYFVWFIFIGAWGCDTFAYFVGKTCGKRKITPTISPTKTLEGTIGGIIGAVIIGAGYSFAITHFFGLEVNILLYSTICGILAVFAQFGDLAASALKRYSGIKDFGQIIPGHGGIMDRFDSILLAAPVFYIIIYII